MSLTVSELIVKLQALPGNLPVEIFDTKTCLVSRVNGVNHYFADECDSLDYASAVLESTMIDPNE